MVVPAVFPEPVDDLLPLLVGEGVDLGAVAALLLAHDEAAVVELSEIGYLVAGELRVAQHAPKSALNRRVDGSRGEAAPPEPNLELGEVPWGELVELNVAKGGDDMRADEREAIRLPLLGDRSAGCMALCPRAEERFDRDGRQDATGCLIGEPFNRWRWDRPEVRGEAAVGEPAEV